MERKNLVPYSVYLPVEYHARLKRAAKERKASTIVRDAVRMMLDGNNVYRAAYNKGVTDSANIISNCKEAKMVVVNRKDLGEILSDKINLLLLK
jgi:hypothetical protein